MTICPICSSNHRISLRKYNCNSNVLSNIVLTKCKNCELVFANPMPTQDAWTLYNSDYFNVAHGGIAIDLNAINFYKGGNVEVTPIFASISEKEFFVDKFNDSLLFFRIDQPRSANSILDRQQLKLRNDPKAIATTMKMVDLSMFIPFATFG